MKLNTLISSAAIMAGCSGGHYSEPNNSDSKATYADTHADTHIDTSAPVDTGSIQPTYDVPPVKPDLTCTLPQDIKNAIAIALSAADCNGLQKGMMPKTNPQSHIFNFPKSAFPGNNNPSDLTLCTDQAKKTQRLSQEGYAPSVNALYLQTLIKTPDTQDQDLYVSLAGIVGQHHLAVVATTDLNPNGTFKGLPVKVDLVSNTDGSTGITYMKEDVPGGAWKAIGTATAQNCEPLLAETNKHLQQNWVPGTVSP